jgi:DNA polymerase-3 subunit beta
MKTRLPRQEFLDALTAAAAVAGGRTTKPILGCVKLATEADTLQVTATDGEMGLRLGVGTFSVDEPGEAVVAADRLLNIVREMPDAEIGLSTTERHCIVQGEGSEFKIFMHPPGDFPPVPGFEDEPDLIVDGTHLWRMINLTIYAAARETSRYAINGVLWQKTGKRLYLVATDGRRLARAGGSVAKSSSADFQVIVPAKALNVFERVFAPARDRGEWTVDIKVMPNQALFRSGDRLLSTALVEGNFPNYEDVLPKECDKLATINRIEFYSAVRRAALLTTDESRAVRLHFEGEELVITGQSPEQGEARVQMPVQYEGQPLEIGFNPVPGVPR